MKNNLDITNKKFGRLIAISRVDNKYWKCKCCCGTEIIVLIYKLLNEHTKSCGCLKKDLCLSRLPKMQKLNTKFSPTEASARTVWIQRYSDGNLSFSDFYSLSQMNCYYCNSQPNNIAFKNSKSNKGPFIHNGLDRVDNSKVHNLENVVPCCKYCNYAKRERSSLEFERWVRNSYNKLFT